MAQVSVSSPNGQSLDPVAGVPIGIDFVHHEIHEGNFFSCSTYAEGLGDGVTREITFLTGAKKLHIFWEATASALAFLHIYEDPTITANTGSTLPVYNHDRNSAVATTVIDRSPVVPAAGAATLNPTVTVPGTQLRSINLGGSNRSGGEARNEGEMILKPNEEYRFVIESGAAGTTCGLILKWYEHD